MVDYFPHERTKGHKQADEDIGGQVDGWSHLMCLSGIGECVRSFPVACAQKTSSSVLSVAESDRTYGAQTMTPSLVTGAVTSHANQLTGAAFTFKVQGGFFFFFFFICRLVFRGEMNQIILMYSP